MAPPEKRRSLAKIGAAGAWAGSMEIVLTYPLEFAKTNLQLQHGAAASAPGFDRGVAHCLRTTVAANGWRGVYAGAAPWFFFAGPRSAVRFAAFDRLSAAAPFGASPAAPFLCGLGAGTFEAALCQTPNQSVSIKLLHDASPAVAVKRYSHLPFHRACAAIATIHGPLAFYDGLFPARGAGVAPSGGAKRRRFQTRDFFRRPSSRAPSRTRSASGATTRSCGPRTSRRRGRTSRCSRAEWPARSPRSRLSPSTPSRPT
jgi:solute carrier family 25 citrate transporter 1